MSDSITTFNVDLRGHKRGKCLSCDQCEEFLLRNIDITHNGWCQYCNHPPVDHEMLQTPEISAVGLHVPFLPLAESTHINLQNTPGNPFLKHESQLNFQNPITSKIVHKCGPCSFETQNFNVFNWHINKFHHGKYFVQCVKCSRYLYSKGSYKLHVNNCQRTHIQVLPHLESESQDDLLPVANDSDREELNCFNPIDIMTELCVELEGKHRASKVLIDKVVLKVQDLLEVCGSDVSLGDISSNYSRKEQYVKSGLFIKPKECLLGSDSSVSKGYFIPFKPLLLSLLKSPEYTKYFCEPYSLEVDNDNGLLFDFFSGVRYNSHPVLSKHPNNVIIVMLYHDDIEIANPLGMKRSQRGKLTMFYIVFLNIPTHLRSQLAHIHLLAVAKASSVKTEEAKSLLLKDFFETLNNLANEGLFLSTLEGMHKFHGCLLSYTGDSLACHNIGGFKEGFSPAVKQPCRTCKISPQDYKTCTYHAMCKLRSDSEINEQLQKLENAENSSERDNLSKEFGLNSRSVLCRLPYFSITKDLLYDPMHIFLEGVVPKETTLFLKSCINARYFTRKILNDSLINFKFHRSVGKTLYPRMFESNLQLNASSSACLNLMLHLPFILKDCFKDECPDILTCFVKLIQIVQIILSPIIHTEMLENLENLIASHQQLFITCYGSENLIPKMHMIIHLPEQIRQHGPTRHHWTMRMEAKNAIAKNKKYFNFKNLPFSVSEYFQMHFAANFWERKGKVKKEIFSPHFQFSDAGKQNITIENSFVNNDIAISDLGKSCFSIPKVMVNSVSFSVGDIVFSGNMTSDKNSFSKIVKILWFKETIYFHCNIVFIKRFLKDINVLDMGTSELCTTFKATKLLTPWPLLSYFIDSNMYVILPCMYNCNGLFD